MKIAILHNFLDNIGGAEIVGLTLARGLNADIYTTNIDKEKIEMMGFKDVLPNIYSIGKVPINAPFKQQFTFYRFEKLNLEKKYDFYIITGEWAISGAVNNKPNLWYSHSPTREIWDAYEYARKNKVPWIGRPIFDLWVYYNRRLNRRHVKNVNKIICNSINTQNRLKKFLNTNAMVINPPTETNKLYYRKNGNYWLSVNRLLAAKRVDLQLRTFSKMLNEKLIIVGSYEQSQHFLQYANYCKKIKPNNVEIKSWVSQQELIDLYANCKGFIATAIDEDFGMTPVEAMASGKPVIAANEGGYKETVINGKTGILIDNIDESKLADAIKKLGEEIDKDPLKFKKDCQEQAKKFDTEIFIEKIKKEIK